MYYYLYKATNSCVTVCPNGGYGNNTDFTCNKCQYFAFNGQCLQSCPDGYVGVIAIISTCIPCTINCSKSLGFKV